MNFFIIDDDINVIKILENIIEDNDLGDVIGTSKNSMEAIDEVKKLKPDIILIDLLMPEIDGINFIKKINDSHLLLEYIMISKVSEKKIISKAYEVGVKFFITKPINRIEVINVCENVKEAYMNRKKLSTINNILDKDYKEDLENELMKNLKFILNDIGISGEKGFNEILEICLEVNKNNQNDFLISEMYNKFEKPNTVKQRIRRALSKGLSNIAALGIEDYMNVKFTRYSNNLYDFQNVKAEMDFLRDKRDKGGKINVSSFINNILILAERGI
ncbi:MAG: DNA-binding domain-containing protein [Bacillota bacterium]